MADYQIVKVTTNPQTDLISVEALALDTGATVTAQGWISATKNYYPPEAYNSDGNHVEGAEPREMTNDERREYIMQLVRVADVRVSEPISEDLTDLFG